MTDKFYIFKSDIKDYENFIAFVRLHNCNLIYDDELYYILEGSPEDVETFRQDWNNRKRII